MKMIKNNETKSRAFAVLAAVGILAVLGMVSLSASTSVQITRNYTSQLTREWQIQAESRAAALAVFASSDRAAAAAAWKTSSTKLKAEISTVNDSTIRVRISDPKLDIALVQVYEQVDARVFLKSETRQAAKVADTTPAKPESKS